MKWHKHVNGIFIYICFNTSHLKYILALGKALFKATYVLSDCLNHCVCLGIGRLTQQTDDFRNSTSRSTSMCLGSQGIKDAGTSSTFSLPVLGTWIESVEHKTHGFRTSDVVIFRFTYFSSISKALAATQNSSHL